MTSSPFSPGPDGSPVPGGVVVLRMANQPAVDQLSPESLRRVQDGKALPTFFELSSEDLKQPVPRLSVWVEGLTTVGQAWVLVGSNPKRRWVLFLAADEVRTITAKPDQKLSATPPLDVQWERATILTADGARGEDHRPGWEGHAGIAPLNVGNKTQRLSLRWQLADLARVQVLSADALREFADDQPRNPTPADT